MSKWAGFPFQSEAGLIAAVFYNYFFNTPLHTISNNLFLLRINVELLLKNLKSNRKETDIMTVQTEAVKKIFNEMSDEYDNLKDLWYRHTFSTIDKILCKYFKVIDNDEKPIALDVGCGTGIQSLRLAELGYKVIGLDISDGLLSIAQNKLKKNGFTDAEFYNVNAELIPYPDNYFDAINCCGPTLPFIENWQSTIKEISRCLKPKGLFLLEVEGKWNFDIFWELTNAIFFNVWGYDESLSESLKHFRHPTIGHYIDYSFKLESGESVIMPIKTFTKGEITKNLKKNNLKIKKSWGLHSLTNIVPSTVLHKSNPSDFTKTIFNILASAEQKIYSAYPFNSFACSLLILSQKQI